MPKNIRLLSWNVNGLRAASSKGLKDFFQAGQFEILCLQEIKMQAEQIPADWAYPAGYHPYWNFAEKKGYSGVAVFSRLKPLQVMTKMGNAEHDQEGRLLILEFDSWILVNTYTPNSQRGLTRLDYRQRWDADYCAFVKNLESQKPVVLCGDFNVAHTSIDLANPSSNYNRNAGYTQVEIDGLAALLQSGFVDTFREFEKGPGHYTWWSYQHEARTHNIGWRIDYFLVSQSLRKNWVKGFILPEVQGSDHCPVGLEMQVE